VPAPCLRTMETLITLTGRPPGGVIATAISSRSCELAIQGRVIVDIRDSVEDWTPFEPLKAPEEAPDVVYIVLDDVGLSAMSSYGGRSRRRTSTRSRVMESVSRSGKPRMEHN
jgi:hypothetical protein